MKRSDTHTHMHARARAMFCNSVVHTCLFLYRSFPKHSSRIETSLARPGIRRPKIRHRFHPHAHHSRLVLIDSTDVFARVRQLDPQLARRFKSRCKFTRRKRALPAEAVGVLCKEDLHLVGYGLCELVRYAMHVQYDLHCEFVILRSPIIDQRRFR